MKMVEIENRISNSDSCKFNHNIKFGSIIYNVDPINCEINNAMVHYKYY